MAKSFKMLASAAARAADDKKGEDIVLYHVGKTSPITDYMLLATATSRPHLETLEQEIERALEELGAACVHKARPRSDTWRVLDFGGVIVHLMTAESRAFYALDKLYHGAALVQWQAPAARKRTAAARR